ncbi:MAG: MFS transporter [Bacteroidota bacterium]
MLASEMKSTPSIFPVLLVNFIGMLGYSLVIPILVFLVDRFGGNEFIYGLLGSIYPAFQLVGAPILGKWSDQIGRRRVLIISQAGTFVAWLIFIVALLIPNETLMEVDSSMFGSFLISLPLILLFFARALDGLTGGNVSVANAYLSDISTDANRKANFGKMGSSTSLGFVIGPVLAGILGATYLGELLPVLLAAAISLVAMFIISRFLPESRPELVSSDSENFHVKKLFQIEHKECYTREDCRDTRLTSLLRNPRILLLYSIYFFTFLGFSFFYAGFPVYASSQLGWDSSQLGLFFAISSGIMVIFQGPVLSYLSAKVKGAYLVLLGSLLIGISFFLFPLGTSFGVWLAVVFLSSGNGLMWPSYLAILAETGDKANQGTIQGYANSMGSLASIFGLILGGVLFGIFGPQIFYIAAFFLLLIFFLSFQLLKS